MRPKKWEKFENVVPITKKKANCLLLAFCYYQTNEKPEENRTDTNYSSLET